MTPRKLHRSGVPYATLKAEAIRLRATGMKTAEIARTLGVTYRTAVRWCAHCPQNRAAYRLNLVAASDRRRLYPKGTDAERRRLAHHGYGRADRIAILHAMAAHAPEARP